MVALSHLLWGVQEKRNLSQMKDDTSLEILFEKSRYSLFILFSFVLVVFK